MRRITNLYKAILSTNNMPIFKKKKNPGYVDLSEKLSKQEERISSFKENHNVEDDESEPKEQSSSGGFFNFFTGQSETKEVQPSSETSTQEERKKKLNKILF